MHAPATATFPTCTPGGRTGRVNALWALLAGGIGIVATMGVLLNFGGPEQPEEGRLSAEGGREGPNSGGDCPLSIAVCLLQGEGEGQAKVPREGGNRGWNRQ